MLFFGGSVAGQSVAGTLKDEPQHLKLWIQSCRRNNIPLVQHIEGRRHSMFGKQPDPLL
jgi:hypothetical protein